MVTVIGRHANPPKVDARPVLFAVMVDFELAAGARDRFLALVKENAEIPVREESGCTRFDVLTPRGPAGVDRVVLYELYTSRVAFDEDLASAHFAAFDAATRELVSRKTIVEFDAAERAKR
jgi:(4S)-4-hydroxy-5-phosphonooxypentane-2,3-dione isomerase